VTGAQSGHESLASDGFGAALRAARTSRGLTLAEASARTRIRASYLAALEEEQLDALPPYPFVRGFLRTYAVELGLDPDRLLQRLTVIMPEPAPRPIEESRRLESTIVPARPLTLAQQIGRSAGIVGLVAGIVLVLYFAKQLHEFSQPVPAATPQGVAPTPAAPTPQAPSQQSPAAPTPAVQVSPAPTPAAPTGVTTQITGNGIAIDVEATGRSWILVVADDVVVYQAFVTAGERRRWQANGSMTVRVGNAGVVILTVNGRSVGPLGGPGEVVSRTFRKDEVR
jgi:cytoskeleton protein RodZ